MTQTPEPEPLTVVYPTPIQRPKWIIPIGVISIVWALMHLLLTLLGAVVNELNPAMEKLEASLPAWYGPYTVVITAGTSAVNVVLLAGGILVLRQRRRARPVHIVYGIAAIVAGLVAAAVGSRISAAAMQAQSQRGAMPAGMIQMFQVIGIVLGALYSAAYPVFVLVWFNRRKVRADMAAWT